MVRSNCLCPHQLLQRLEVAQLVQWLQRDTDHQRGEMVLMIGPAVVQSNQLPSEAIELLKQLKVELPLKKAAAIVAQHYQLKKNELYKFGLTLEQ